MAIQQMAQAMSYPQPTQSGALQHRHWHLAYRTQCGPRHGACEDACAAVITPNHGLTLALADGVSKGAYGVVAATELVNACLAIRGNEQLTAHVIEEGLRQADRHVADAIRSMSDAQGAACLVAAWFEEDGHGYIAHVGDCRAYAVAYSSDGRLDLHSLTVDQSYLNLREEPPVGVSVDNPARMIGLGHFEAADMARVSIQKVCVQPESGVIFATDGVHDVLSQDDIAGLLGPHAGEHGAWMSDRLPFFAASVVSMAQEAGSMDDIGVAILWRTSQ
jgi:serine/threonine protein phosphatase PrpC